MKHKVKITVLRREYYQDLADKYLADPNVGKCQIFEDGQEIMVETDDYFRLLHGNFCSEAWDAISRYVYTALQGGSIMRGWTNDEKMMIACCNDGTRPVIFKIERIDEGVSTPA
ncbi:MAG: TIGR04076 family protein [Planctomycetaceae bacterium]|nr:TIGR04076 family protein [Planctomycetaceae bacterium]